MNEHENILALIPGYPELRTPERQRVDAHAQTCDECATALQRQRHLRNQLAHAPRLVPDPAAVEAVRAAVRQKSSRSATAARAVVRPRWLMVAAPAGVFALVAVLVGLLVVRPGWLRGWDTTSNAGFGRGQGSLPPAQSAAVGEFVWQTDGAYGYEMLRPAGWEAVDRPTVDPVRVFDLPDRIGNVNGLGIRVMNPAARRDVAEADGMATELLRHFERDRTLDGWTTDLLRSISWTDSPVRVLRSLPNAKIILFSLDASTGAPQATLLGLKVEAGNPLVVQLTAQGWYADLDRLESEGIVDDLVTMIETARAIPVDPQNVAPALSGNTASPTPVAVIATRVVADPKAGVGRTSLSGPVPTPVSSLVGSFVIQVDKDYEMLRPMGWEAVDHGASHGYVAPGSRGAIDRIELQVVNYAAQFANRPQTTSVASAEWLAFQQNPTLSGWTAAAVLSWQSMGLQPVELRELPEAVIYTYEYPNSNPPARALVAYKLDRGQPLGVVLTAQGAYADLDRLQREGLVDDFVTMVESLRATDAGPQAVAPAVATVAPAAPNPTMAPQATSINGLPATCAADDPNTLLLVSPESGYCLRYPAAFQPRFGGAPDWPAGTWGVSFFHPHDPNHTMYLDIQTSLANGRTLEQVMAEKLSQHPAEITAQVSQTPSKLGGEPAIILDGLPGVLMNRQAFVIHGDRLHRLVLAWQDDALGDRQAEAQALWDQVANSLAFVPALDASYLDGLLRSGPTPTVMQRVEVGGLAAELRAVEFTESGLSAEFCLDLPDSRDWHPMPRLSQGERRIDNGFSGSLIDGKLTQTAYATRRCYRFSFQLQSPGFSMVEPMTLSIERLALEPNEGEVGQVATCEAALRRLAERQPSIRAKCVARGDGTFPELVSMPDEMTRDLANRLVWEGYSEFVNGPWAFTIQPTNITPTNP